VYCFVRNDCVIAVQFGLAAANRFACVLIPLLALPVKVITSRWRATAWRVLWCRLGNNYFDMSIIMTDRKHTTVRSIYGHRNTSTEYSILWLVVVYTFTLGRLRQHAVDNRIILGRARAVQWADGHSTLCMVANFWSIRSYKPLDVGDSCWSPRLKR